MKAESSKGDLKYILDYYWLISAQLLIHKGEIHPYFMDLTWYFWFDKEGVSGMAYYVINMSANLKSLIFDLK